MYTRLAKTAEELKPLKFGWFSIFTRCHNIKILLSIRQYFTEWANSRDANIYSYEHLVDFLEFTYLASDVLPPISSGILIYKASEDSSKTSYECTEYTYIVDINNSVTPFTKLSIYIDLNKGSAEIKYISDDYKDIFILVKDKGPINTTGSHMTHIRTFALQEIRYAMSTYIQQYIAKLYEIYA